MLSYIDSIVWIILCLLSIVYSIAKVRVMPLPHGGVGAHKCFSQLKCPDTSVTWCFNLYHPTKLIEICWDSNNNVLNMTEGAALLELNRYFTTGDVS